MPALHEQLRSQIGKVTKVCTALAAELFLLRVSAYASHITHLLRAAGPYFIREALVSFDAMQRAVLSDTLGALISDRVWLQATLSASEAELVVPRSRYIQLPVFLASRAEARGLAEERAAALPAAVRDVVFSIWDSDVGAAA